MANSKFINGDMLDRTVKNIGLQTDARYIKKNAAVSAVLPCVSEDDLDENITEYWVYDNETETYYYNLPVTGITADNMAIVNVPLASQDTAQACGLYPSNNTLAGYVRFYTITVPSTEIAINLWTL